MRKIMLVLALSFLAIPIARAESTADVKSVEPMDMTAQPVNTDRSDTDKRPGVIKTDGQGVVDREGLGNAYEKLLKLGYTPEQSRHIINHFEDRKSLKEFVKGQRKEANQKRIDQWLKNHPHAANNVKKDVKELREDIVDRRQDRRDLNQDKRERREDVRDLRQDIRDGASAGEIKSDRREIRGDTKDIRSDRRELRSDNREIRSDRREIRHDAHHGRK